MQPKFTSLVSENHNEKLIDATLKEFYVKLQKKIGCKLEDLRLPLVFIKSGGTEGLFKKQFEGDKGPFYLLTTNLFNSLPAAIEILSYLKQNRASGEIIHGDVGTIAKKIMELKKIYDHQR